MANKHEVELFISDDGELKVHIKGIKGPGCKKVLESLARDAGGQLTGVELTSEYYEQNKDQNIQRNKNERNPNSL